MRYINIKVTAICVTSVLAYLDCQNTLPHIYRREQIHVIWYLAHWDRDKMAAISQTTVSHVFFLYENNWILLKFALIGSLENIPVLVKIMAWRRLGDKPLHEPTMARLPTHICVTRPVNNDKGYACIKSCSYIYDIFSWNHGYFHSLMAQKLAGMIEI